MKHVLVTGASSGIGFECCRYLLQLDMSVLGIARRPISMKIDDPQPEHFYSISADLTHKSSYDRISSFYSEHAIDVIDYIIICAAQIDPITSLLSAQGDDLVSNFSLNVLSPLYLLQSLQSYFNGTRILFVGSDSAHKPRQNWGIYSIGKAAQKMLSDCLHKESNPLDYRIGYLRPGGVDTAIFNHALSHPIETFPDQSVYQQCKDSGALKTPQLAAAEICDFLVHSRDSDFSNSTTPPSI